VLTHREHAHEVIAFDLAGFLRKRWTALHDERLVQLRQLVGMRIRLGILASLGNTLLFLAPVTVVSFLLVSGSLEFSQAVDVVGWRRRQ